jgi:hypothetical protein
MLSLPLLLAVLIAFTVVYISIDRRETPQRKQAEAHPTGEYIITSEPVPMRIPLTTYPPARSFTEDGPLPHRFPGRELLMMGNGRTAMVPSVKQGSRWEYSPTHRRFRPSCPSKVCKTYYSL